MSAIEADRDPRHLHHPVIAQGERAARGRSGDHVAECHPWVAVQQQGTGGIFYRNVGGAPVPVRSMSKGLSLASLLLIRSRAVLLPGTGGCGRQR